MEGGRCKSTHVHILVSMKFSSVLQGKATSPTELDPRFVFQRDAERTASGPKKFQPNAWRSAPGSLDRGIGQGSFANRVQPDG